MEVFVYIYKVIIFYDKQAILQITAITINIDKL